MSVSEKPPVATAGQNEQHPRQWWRYPIVWLVIGGPLAVVVASLATAVVAVRGADPVLMRDESGGASEVRQGADSMTPAVQARNHAATPKQTP